MCAPPEHPWTRSLIGIICREGGTEYLNYTDIESYNDQAAPYRRPRRAALPTPLECIH